MSTNITRALPPRSRVVSGQRPDRFMPAHITRALPPKSRVIPGQRQGLPMPAHIKSALKLRLWAALLPALLAVAACQPDGFPPPEGANAPAGPDNRATASVEGRVLLPARPTRPAEIAEIVVDIEAREIPEGIRVETVAEGLEIPWDLAFPPDGRILITERPGRIRVVEEGALQAEPYATLNVAHVSEAGLMGIALHPDFARNGHLFVCYTYRDDAGRWLNRIARLTEREGRGADHRTILDAIPGASRHDGCRIRFGPDGYLYATTGDATAPELAQDLDSLAGKVLRLTAEGAAPAENPFPNSPVYTYGHRNPQGLAWHPETGDLFSAEHGPDRDDEVNRLEPGGNYGWPRVTGVAGNPRFLDPLLSLTPTVAIAGAAFYSEGRLAHSWEGNLLFTALKGSHLQRVALEPPEFRSVRFREVLFRNEFGRLRAVAMAPDGYVYLTTSNRDGRGRPRPGDDRLLRLTPLPPVPLARFQPDAQGNFRLELAPGTYQLRWESAELGFAERRIAVRDAGKINLGVIELTREDG